MIIALKLLTSVLAVVLFGFAAVVSAYVWQDRTLNPGSRDFAGVMMVVYVLAILVSLPLIWTFPT